MSRGQPVIVVTGSKGFVGSAVTKRLLASGADVRGLTLEDGVDITDWSGVRLLKPFDVCVHLASSAVRATQRSWPFALETSATVSKTSPFLSRSA